LLQPLLYPLTFLFLFLHNKIQRWQRISLDNPLLAKFTSNSDVNSRAARIRTEAYRQVCGEETYWIAVSRWTA
jgi:hypothetical protein